MDYADLSPTEALDRIRSTPPPVLLDVRTEPEFTSHRIEDAVLIPVQELAARLDELPPSEAGYVVVCEHGVRSVAACTILSEAGHAPLVNVRGGMARWIGDGLDFVRGAPEARP